jgi:hypothetical protein
MEGLIGFAGVIIGISIGSGYSFWATRRSELAAAGVATAILGEELRALTLDHGTGSGDRRALRDAWRDQRRGLVLYLEPKHFRKLASSIYAQDDGGDRWDAPELTQRIDSLYALFWREHRAPMSTAISRATTRNTARSQARSILDA